MKIIKIFITYILITIKRFKIYKFNYILSFIGNILFQFKNIIIILTLFNNIIKKISWNIYEMLFYYAFSQTIILIYWMIYVGVYQLPKFLNDGSWDRYNFYPINPLYLLIIENIDISRIIHIIFSTGILIYSIIMLAITKIHINLFFLLFEIIIGISMLGNFTIILGSFSFYTKRSRQSFAIIVYMVQMLILYPFFLYNKYILLFLKFIIPFYYITYYPSLFLLNKSNNLNELIIQLMLFIILKLFSICLFNFNKKYYVSSS